MQCIISSPSYQYILYYGKGSSLQKATFNGKSAKFLSSPRQSGGVALVDHEDI